MQRYWQESVPFSSKEIITFHHWSINWKHLWLFQPVVRLWQVSTKQGVARVPRITVAVTFVEGRMLSIRSVETGSVLLTWDSCISSSFGPYRCCGTRVEMGACWYYWGGSLPFCKLYWQWNRRPRTFFVEVLFKKMFYLKTSLYYKKMIIKYYAVN